MFDLGSCGSYGLPKKAGDGHKAECPELHAVKGLVRSGFGLVFYSEQCHYPLIVIDGRNVSQGGREGYPLPESLDFDSTRSRIANGFPPLFDLLLGFCEP